MRTAAKVRYIAKGRRAKPDPDLHALLMSHYRLSGTAQTIGDNLSRMSALIDARMPQT